MPGTNQTLDLGPLLGILVSTNLQSLLSTISAPVYRVQPPRILVLYQITRHYSVRSCVGPGFPIHTRGFSSEANSQFASASLQSSCALRSATFTQLSDHGVLTWYNPREVYDESTNTYNIAAPHGIAVAIAIRTEPKTPIVGPHPQCLGRSQTPSELSFPKADLPPQGQTARCIVLMSIQICLPDQHFGTRYRPRPPRERCVRICINSNLHYFPCTLQPFALSLLTASSQTRSDTADP